MHYKTKGIVLHQVKYSESSIIVKVYTELFGLRSFIFKGVRKKKSSLKEYLEEINIKLTREEYLGIVFRSFVNTFLILLIEKSSFFPSLLIINSSIPF